MLNLPLLRVTYTPVIEKCFGIPIPCVKSLAIQQDITKNSQAMLFYFNKVTRTFTNGIIKIRRFRQNYKFLQKIFLF